MNYCGLDNRGVLLPSPKIHAGDLAKDLLLYSLTVISLCLFVWAFCGIVFEVLDYVFHNKDSIDRDYMSWLIAQVIVQCLFLFG